MNVVDTPTLSGQYLLYQETNETSQLNNWRGIFSPDLSIAIPDREPLAFTLANRLGGQLALAGQVGDLWLVDGAVLAMYLLISVLHRST
jgi:hypothetical protein